MEADNLSQRTNITSSPSKPAIPPAAEGKSLPPSPEEKKPVPATTDQIQTESAARARKAPTPHVDETIRRTLALTGDSFAEKAHAGANANVATVPDKPNVYLRVGAVAGSTNTVGQWTDMVKAVQTGAPESIFKAGAPFADRDPGAQARAGVALGFDSKYFGVELAGLGAADARMTGTQQNFTAVQSLYTQSQGFSAQLDALNQNVQTLQSTLQGPAFQGQISSLRSELDKLADPNLGPLQKLQALQNAQNIYQQMRPTVQNAIELMNQAASMTRTMETMAQTVGDGQRSASMEVSGGTVPQLKLKGRLPLPDVGPFTKVAVGASVKGIYIPANPLYDSCLARG